MPATASRATLRRPRRLFAGSALALVLVAGCAAIPKGQYGVTEIGWLGTEAVNPDAIESCLVTREREPTLLRLGLGTGSCGQPPFDSKPPKLVLWTNPWVEWPVYDPAIFELDKRRIERWYRARGYYDARVVRVRTYVDDQLIADPIECDRNKSSCKLQLMVEMDEGQPTHIGEIAIESKAVLPPELMKKLRAALTVEEGERFDEYDYEQDKTKLQQALWNASYARASVSGHVSIDRDARLARVVYTLEPGPACVFGKVVVEGAGDIPVLLIQQAADIPEGKPYSYERVLDAEQAVFALGAFSAAQMKPQGEGSVVDMVASVRVGQLVRWSGGIGVMSGTMQRSIFDTQQSVPQWDVHLSAAWEHRNFLGGLRRLRIEERPRLIQLAEFPKTTAPHFGNLLSIRFEQPATFERRTTLFSENSWDFGPDPYKGFFRQDVTDKLGLERPFFRRRLMVRAAVAHDIFKITDDQPPSDVSSYLLPYLEQQVILDLRNNSLRPRYGAYFGIVLQQAFRFGTYGSWNYVRVAPEIRGYVPLMWDFVLAARFAVAALFIGSHDTKLDMDSQVLGPQVYRLRGGGANSNRGFSAGTLGAGLNGGNRRYEGSIELRVPFGDDFGLVLFGDVGNVTKDEKFHFAELHAATGFGLRYFTILGAIRLDLAWRIRGLQHLGSSRSRPGKEELEADSEMGDVWPDAWHLTIGEAF